MSPEERARKLAELSSHDADNPLLGAEAAFTPAPGAALSPLHAAMPSPAAAPALSPVPGAAPSPLHAAAPALSPVPGAAPASATLGFFEKGWFSRTPDPWEHTSHAFGFLGDTSGSSDLVPLQHAGSLQADRSLVDARIDVTLERLRVAGYPGRGVHRILFDFYGRSQRADGADDLHFNVVVRVREGQSAAVLGVPIFLGLGVGGSGVAFRCSTVNVKNDGDEAILAILESDAMKNGLHLLETAQPAIGIVSCLAVGLTKALANRHRNVAVQDFSMGLDLGGAAPGARLRLGTYFAVQAPDEIAASCWSDWVYNRQSGLLVHKDSPGKPIGYNYVAFGVRKHEAP